MGNYFRKEWFMYHIKKKFSSVPVQTNKLVEKNEHTFSYFYPFMKNRNFVPDTFRKGK